MEINFGWTFVIILCLSRISITSSSAIKNGTFHALHRHPMLRRCASASLKKNEFVGARISVPTGKCEGLSHSWGLNQTIQNGYAYVMKTFVQESFRPPIKASPKLNWIIPGVFDKGAMVDVDITMPSTDWEAFSMNLFDTPDAVTDLDGNRVVHVSFSNIMRKIILDEYDTYTWESFQNFAMPPQLKPGSDCKISFVSREPSLEIRVCDEWTRHVPTLVSLVTLQQLVWIADGNMPLVHSFTFTTGE